MTLSVEISPGAPQDFQLVEDESGQYTQRGRQTIVYSDSMWHKVGVSKADEVLHDSLASVQGLPYGEGGYLMTRLLMQPGDEMEIDKYHLIFRSW